MKKEFDWNLFNKIGVIMVWIMVFLILGMVLALFQIVVKIKSVEVIDTVFDKLVDDNNKEFYIEWLYTCPSYVSAHYTCPKELQFENLTGKYCGSNITCGNSYIIHIYKPFQKS